MLPQLKGRALNLKISDYLLENGAVSVGFTTRGILQDSPPGADITYLMKSGLSAVSFAVPMDTECIRSFLAKEDRFAHQRDEMDTNIKARVLSDGVAGLLRGEGYNAIGTAPNATYRIEVEKWHTFMPPEISHRYIAVVSGAGSFGWSGCVGVKGYGTAIVLGTTLTDAELEPTFPIPEEENFCSNCKACVGACPTEMFSGTDTMTVTLGGREYTHAARIDLYRCFLCCGGTSGLHKSKKWSSWSPGRFEVPQTHDELVKTLLRAGKLRRNWVEQKGAGPTSLFHSADARPQFRKFVNPDLILTCGNCGLVCTGDKKENVANLKILRNSGCVIQYPDGSIKVLPQDEAETQFSSMDPEHRSLYC